MGLISLKSVAPENFELLAGWLSDPEINRWLTSEWRGKIINPTLLAIAVRNRRNRIFVFQSEEKSCGIVALADIEPVDSTAMVWYALGDQDFVGQGVTSSAVVQLAEMAFTEMGLKSLYAWTMSDNYRSQRVLLKAGFREAGRIRNSAISGTTRVDRVYFDLVAVVRSDRVQ